MDRIKKAIDRINIKRIVKICIVIFFILMSILLCFVFIPQFKWEWLDRNYMISSTCTLIGGFFGLIGALIGVVGTYGAFYLEVEEEKRKKLEYNKLMLFNLLDYTILKTKSIYDELLEYYKNSIKDAKNEGVDLVNIMYKVSGVSEDESEFGANLETDIGMLYMSMDKPEIEILIRGLNIYFIEDILGDINLNDLIYDNNWCSYIGCISEMKENGANRDMQRIIDWLGNLKRQYTGHTNYTGYTEYEVINFIMERSCIKGIIDELGKEIKEQGFRKNFSRLES